jgi:hypothetical protein
VADQQSRSGLKSFKRSLSGAIVVVRERRGVHLAGQSDALTGSSPVFRRERMMNQGHEPQPLRSAAIMANVFRL